MNQATQKMIDKIKGWNYDQIQQKVNNEYLAGEEIAREKRPLLKSYLESYNVDGKKSEGAVKSKSLYTYRNLFVSALYKNKPLVTFQGRKQGDSEYADTWNNLLKFDYEELDEDATAYKKISNSVDYGIYLAVDEGWDKTTESPKKKLYNPLCWIPDPYFDIVKGFNFHGFELILSDQEVNELYQNKELMLTNKELKELKEKLGSSFDDGLYNWAAGYGVGFKFITYQSPLKEYSVYRHFTKFNGRWYLTEWANNRTLLIRCEEIKAVREEEKKDPTKIPCPVVHSWLLPKEGDPYGLCVGDLAKDNQDSEETIMNLLINKVNEEVFSGVTIYNDDVVDGKELAHRKLGSRKYVPAKGNLENREIIKNIQTQTSGSGDGYNLKNMIDSKATKEIGFDEQSIGVYAKTITATQSELLQANQNVRLSTMFKVFLRGEKRYWDVLWYRSYQANFKMKSQKNIVLNSGVGKVTYTVMGKDLNTKADLHLSLSTVLDDKEREEKNKSAFMASYQPLMEQAGAFGKIELTRKFSEVMGMDKEFINMVYEFPDEYNKALSDLELLNLNEDVGEIRDMTENHQIYINVYNQAVDTEAKTRAILARKRALLLSGQAKMLQAQQAMGGMDAGSQNQLASNFISQQNQASNQPTALGPTAGNEIPTEG